MSRFNSVVPARLRPVTSTDRIQLVGHPAGVVVAFALAVVGGVGTARYVAATESYLTIQHAIPTYDGSTGPLFYTGGLVLLTLAVGGAVIEAGLLPTVTLTGAPVFGWAVNHFASPITPHYASTFPLEMALLYGGVFGLVGYLSGTALRFTIGRLLSRASSGRFDIP